MIYIALVSEVLTFLVLIQISIKMPYIRTFNVIPELHWIQSRQKQGITFFYFHFLQLYLNNCSNVSQTSRVFSNSKHTHVSCQLVEAGRSFSEALIA